MSVKLPPDTCGIWSLSPRPGEEYLADLLPDAERERATRFRFEADRACYVAAHALARLVAGSLTGEAPRLLHFDPVCANCGGAHGKPRVRGTSLEMSISHSGQRVAVAFAWDVPVGVDIEDLVPPRADASLIARVLSAEEQAALAAVADDEHNAAFLRYWTRKEAILKATGYGLAVDLQAVTVSAPGQPPRMTGWTADRPLERPVCLSDLDLGEGHVAAVAVLGRPLTFVVRDDVPPAG